MKQFTIAIAAIASFTAAAQSSSHSTVKSPEQYEKEAGFFSPEMKEHMANAKPRKDSLEWVISPDGKDTFAYKYKGKEPVIKKPAELTTLYWQTRQERDLVIKKLQYAQMAFRFINLQGEVTDPKTFHKIME